MTGSDALLTGAPCWIDLTTSDVGASREFYSKLFGWSAEEPSAEFGGYFMFTHNGAPIAGGMPNQPDFGVPDGWSVYLATADARKTVDAAQAGGGTVRAGIEQVADLGAMAVLEDPGGARIGLWQAGSFAGFTALGVAGAPSWFELHTRDYDAVVAFYRDVLGWDAHTMSDTPEFRYTTLGEGRGTRAGIMDATGFLPDGVAAHWSVYFWVDDTDATLATVTRLGGAVLRSAEDTPYGRLATAADPTGAQFKLMAANDAMPARPA